MSDDAMDGTLPSARTPASGTPPPAPPPLESGSLVEGFRVEHVIRRRPGATVHRATPDTGTGGPLPGIAAPPQVLLTVVDRELSANPGMRAHFARSVDLAARVRHPGIARIVGHGLWREHLWVATAPVPATDAAALIERHPDGTDVDRAVRIVAAAGEALDTAHRSGLVHGGLTPTDLLLSGEDVVTVSGFGVTPPPADGPHHPSTDVSALARILVTLLTGTTSVARQRISAAVSPASYAVLERALDPAPDHRHRTCGEFVRAADLTLHPTHTAGEPATEVIGSQAPTAPHAGPRVFIPSGTADTPTTATGIRRPWFPGSGAAHNVPHAARMPRPPVTSSRGKGDRHRRRWLPSLVVVTVVSAVLGTLALVGARPTPTPWPPAVAPIAEAFPRLIAASPETTGWRESWCTAVVDDGINGISCEDPGEVTYALWHTPTPQAHATITGRLKGYPGNAIRWRDGPAAASRDSLADGWVVTNFTAPHHAAYTLVTTWPRHSGRQILDGWWRAAPLG